MQNRMILVGVLGVGACVLGAGVWMSSGGKKPADAGFAAAGQESIPEMRVVETEQGPVEAPEGASGRRLRGGGDTLAQQIEERMKRFDLDGDGILSAEERKAFRQSMRAERLEGMDLDGDGEISLEERVISRREQILESDWGQQVAARFDADGDGVLSDEEIAAMDAAIMEREQNRMARDLERYDADGDGVLSESERETQRVDRDNRQEQRMQRFAEEFDRDGDGDLNEDERVSAFSTMMDRREVRQFLDRYDNNKDGTIGDTEYQRFLSSYTKEEPFADVNHDGRVDAEDVMAFRDYIERARTMP